MTNQRWKRGRFASYVSLAAMIPMLSGCLERELKPLNPCLVSGVNAAINVENIDKIDLLFMVDNSISMKGEQESLAREFPKLIKALTTGDRDGNGTQDFSPATDLHLGVISSDLGLPGINAITGCVGPGDDGVLQGSANPMVQGCSASMFSPPFLTYNAARGDDPTQLATDFSCIATLGIEGCGYEQQLESVLKAVWPGSDPSRTFVADPVTSFGMTGNAGPGFPNGDFIRPDSLIAIVVVTDEEDCSSRQLDHFVPQHSTTGQNTRCFHEGMRPEPNNLFDVERYIESFKALRPGRENLVIFAGIVGVPERLVTREAMARYDDLKQAGQTDTFFDDLLAAPEMQERVDDMGTTDPMDDNLIPSCDRGTVDTRAYPPRRIVEVAKGFGKNGVIQSICQDDFGPAIDAIIDVIANQIGDVCLPRPLVRNSDGMVECNVVWELPKEPNGEAPTACDQHSFLLPPGAGRAKTGASGGAACRVAQLAVVDLATPNAKNETKMPVATLNDGTLIDQGWYYDEFSTETQLDCKLAKDKQRITFTTMAEPPTGVVVKLECLNETQSLPNTRTDLARDVAQPAVGSPCANVMLRNQELSGDDACVVLLAQPVNGNVEDRGMFCHTQSQVCVQACATTADCPAAWVCDTRKDSMDASGGRAYCTNPTCGSSQD
jgi:hypothetical protein